MPAIQVVNLSHRFGKTTALTELSFSLEEGGFTVIAGCSGAGKTTLLRVLAGLEAIQTGTIAFGNKDVGSLPPNKRGIAMVRQDAALYPQVSAIRNITMALPKSRGKESESTAMAALQELGMDQHAQKLPSELSGGEAQRVALARALAANPSLLLLDEPLSQIDGVHKEAMLEAIQKVSKSTTTLMVSHDPWDTMRLADQVLILEQGKLLQQGTPEQIYTAPGSRLAGNLLAPVAMNWLPKDRLAEQETAIPPEQLLPWIGFRPEHVVVMDPQSAPNTSGLQLDVRLASARTLGLHTLLTVNWNQFALRVLLPTSHEVPSGNLSLFVPSQYLCGVND